MKKTKKAEKPAFAKNIVLRRKALGWSATVLAEKAEIPYPTLRDIEAGYNAGKEVTKNKIAKALGASISDLYLEQDNESSMPLVERGLRSAEVGLSMEFVADVIQRLASADPRHRAAVVALLYNEPSLARVLPQRQAAPKAR